MNRCGHAPRFSNQRNHALTLMEVLVVIAVLAFLAAVLVATITAYNVRKDRISCVNNLNEIGLAYRVWAGDNNDKYPMEISVTNGGAMELAAIGDVVATFQIMSNELSTPKILVCDQDKEHKAATNFFEDFTSKNISYFVGIDAALSSPQIFLSGDDNFEIGGVPVKSGLLELSSNTPITWSAARHKFTGNIALADGSVQGVNNSMLTNWSHQFGSFTNRLAIP